MIYISHPYTGNEKENIASAERIAVELAKKYPDLFFINPIATMKHEGIAGRGYQVILNNCLELLGHCQAVIFTGDWKNSKGCMTEYGYAKGMGIFVYESVESFNQSRQ
jgi:hypothetical protein